jgi:preprotein translocase subunit SecA
MLKFLTNLFDTNEKPVNHARKIVEQINALEPQVKELSYDQIRARINEVRTELKSLVDKIPEKDRTSLRRVDHAKGLSDLEKAIQQKLLEFMPEMYAFIRESYGREMGIRHFDEQLIAGVILAGGQKLTEVKTGEGKTMIFNLPAFLYSLVGRGAHVVTVNDYLAKRDAEYAGHIASKLGLTLGVVAPGGISYKFITNEEVRQAKGEEAFKELEALGKPKLANMKGLNLLECSKREAYNCDITVSVNNELGFDYLRDNMAVQLDQIVQRELYFCVVDEADSILIDEARTPLIISAIPSESDTEKYKRFAKAVRDLEEEKHYVVDHKRRAATLTEEGIENVEKALDVENIWADYSLAHHIDNALRAKVMFNRDDHYLVRDGEVLIVDTFTGRVMEGRRYSEGLHQAIEAKEGVEIKQESRTFATITFQNFFRLYKVLCGGSGTIMTEAEEFFKIYSLESVVVPTHRQLIREDKNDLIYATEVAKFKAVVNEIKQRHAAGQPILIGTASIEKSELLSGLLDEVGVPHTVLNAKYHDREAQVVAKAGERGAVTVATNMAGRGTDIPLGEGVKELGGLAVIGTERHEARRIDNQLRGRSGRQGDPGYTRFYVSLEDTIMKVMGGDFLSRSVGKLMDDDMPIELGLISRQIETAQKRIEGMNFDSRKQLVEYDDVMNQHREVFYQRRYRLMLLTENALGRFAQAALLADPKLAKQRQAEIMLELADYVRDIVNNELDFTVQSQFNYDRTLDSERVTGLVNQILDFAPDVLIAKAFSFNHSELVAKLRENVQGADAERVIEFLHKGFDKLLDAKIAEFGKDLPLVSKMLILDSMDKQWVDHLETMGDILEGIGLQAHAQRDPLVEYKNIGFRQFESFINRIDSSVARRLLKVTRVEQGSTVNPQQLVTNSDEITDVLTGDHEIKAGNLDLSKLVKRGSQKSQNLRRQVEAAGGTQKSIHAAAEAGRNDPCPCGSGLKYKKCGLLNTPDHQKRMAALK